MTLLGKEAIRLLRTKWKNPVPLAEELYAILQSNEPVDTGPLAVDGTKDPTQPAVKITSPVGSTPLQIQVPGIGDFNFTVGADGGLVLTGPSYSTPQGQQQPSGGGGGVPCQVLSGGPGAGPYQVKLYPFGPTGTAGATVSATQLSIADDETLPAGTWAFAVQTGGPPSTQPLKYWVQVPVWGADPS